ncbi:ABC transporter permease [Caproiciproducens sp. CPB-2]|uniref:ABC transporter permease n=1 Tax=Caproiciproducens sp. CPB-2 TaxID=3030017 RepID=UPI0023D9C7A1|nr:ABC transporter permease [Caproiciproducens sp. CPB-2]MDF1493831.1 ABC transporter permease [Caproiciproducens sp. CPB-2]
MVKMEQEQSLKSRKRHVGGALPYLLALPYLIICALFLVFPVISIIVHSFDSGLNGWIAVARNSTYVRAFRGSFLLAFWTTAEAAVIGGLLALFWAPKLSKHSWFLAFVNFGAHNGGVSLAFSFIATLGTNGMLSLLLKHIGIGMLADFKLVSLSGLHWAYLSFLVPFMCLIFMPAVGCLKPEWFAAARTLGAGKLRYFLKIAGPVLLPSFLSSTTLVFLQAMGTYATAQAITDNRINLITLQIGYLMQMSVFNRSDADILSVVLLLIMIVTTCIYDVFNKRASKWIG